MNKSGRWTSILAAAVLAQLAFAGVAAACPVCFGEADDPMIHGARWAIVFMGALVYGIVLGGIALAVLLHRRARRNLDPHRGLRLLPPQG